jgi:hypothetical protein
MRILYIDLYVQLACVTDGAVVMMCNFEAQEQLFCL